MNAEEFLKSLSEEQVAAFIAIRDSIHASNGIQNSELVNAKNAEMEPLKSEIESLKASLSDLRADRDDIKSKHDALLPFSPAKKEADLLAARAKLAQAEAEIAELNR